MGNPDGLESHGDLADKVFGDFMSSGHVQKLAKVAIRTQRNKEALGANNSVLDRMPGTATVYLSLDEVCHKEGAVLNDSLNFTTEFLNQMMPSGIPPYELRVLNEKFKGWIVIATNDVDIIRVKDDDNHVITKSDEDCFK